MTSIREFEKQVWEAEGVRLVLRATQEHADANHNLRPYRVHKGIDDACPVRRFKIIIEAYTDIPFAIVGGNGLRPSLSVKLGEVRKTYTAPPVKVAKKSAGAAALLGFVKENVEARELAKKQIKNLCAMGVHHSQAKSVLVCLEVIKKRKKIDVPLKTTNDALAEVFLRNTVKLIGFKSLSLSKIVEMLDREIEGGPDSEVAKVRARELAKDQKAPAGGRAKVTNLCLQEGRR